MRILLIKGQSQYDALRVFLDEAKVAFEDLGHQVVLIDVAPPEAAQDFGETLSRLGRFDFAFSYNIFGDWRSAAGQSVGQIIGAPHIVQYVDHPFTHHARVSRTTPDSVILTVDESHADVVKSVFGHDHFAFVGFHPHAAVGQTVALPDEAKAYAESRPTRFLFTGSYYRPRERPWATQSEPIRAIFDEAVERALSQDWAPAHEALAATLRARGLGAGDKDTITLMPHCFRVHEWVRAHRRFQFLNAAAKAKLPMTVFGKGYEQDLPLYDNIDYRGAADFRDVLWRMSRSRIVLNVNVNFGQGSHERPLCAMLAGAVCASEPSTFYAAHFETGAVAGDMTYFRWSSLDEDLDRLRDLAEDPDALRRMAASGQAKAAAGHTWKSRAERVIAIAQGARAGRSRREQEAPEHVQG